MPSEERGDVQRQLLGEHRRACQHACAALHALTKRTELGAQAVERAKHLAGSREQGFAGRCELDTAAAAQQQRHADFGFQRRDALAQCGGDQRFALGRACDAAFLAHGDKMLQRDGIDGPVHGFTWRSRLERES